MNTLELSAIRCTLKHINVRKEGNEEDGLELANDLKFALLTRADTALRALGVRDLALAAALYDKDDNPQFPELKALVFALEMDDHNLQLDGETVSFGRVTLKSFALELLGPGPEAELTFVAQVHPSPVEQAALAERLREEVLVTIEPPNTLPGVAKKGTIKGGETAKGKK